MQSHQISFLGLKLNGCLKDKEKNVWPKPIRRHWRKIYKLKIYYTSNLRLSWESELLLSKEIEMKIKTLPNLSITSNKHKILGGVCLTVQVKQMRNIPCNTYIQRYSSLRKIFPWDCRIQKRNSQKKFKLSLAICDGLHCSFQSYNKQ